MTESDQVVEEGGLALVGEFGSMREANEYALVVLAMNLDCWMRMEAGGQHFAIYAEPAFAVAIREEFALYTEEQSTPKDRKPEVPLYHSGMEFFLLWAIGLVFVFMNQTELTEDRYCNSSIPLFEQGEWWRPFTSLFLHGDFPHLLGNILIGGIFCVMVAHTIGPLVGWLAILMSGTLGNIATAKYYYPEEFLSLGASTATFGALGLLVGSSVYLVWRSRSLRKIGGAVIPIVAGAVLLGWFGAGGPQVDVLAHVMGFLMGAMLGLLIALVRPSASSGSNPSPKAARA
jgi:rhomboid protease GluP